MRSQSRLDWFCILGFCLTPLRLLGGDPVPGEVVLPPVVHAKSIVVVQGLLPNGVTSNDIALEISSDGQEYVNARAGVPRGKALVMSLFELNGRNRVAVSVVGRFDMTPVGFLFPRAGNYHVRFRLGDNTGVRTANHVESVVRVVNPNPIDERFLDRIGDERFVRRLVGDPAFETLSETAKTNQQTLDVEDSYSLEIIHQLLEATRIKEFGDIIGMLHGGDVDGAMRWADALWSIETDLPESSYSPYAAFYAGACYSAIVVANSVETVRMARAPGQRKDKIAEYIRRGELVKGDDRFARAVEGLEFAVKRGDSYLAPIASYHLGLLQIFSGDVESGENSLGQAASSSGEHGTVRDLVEKFQQEFGEIKEGLANRHSDRR